MTEQEQIAAFIAAKGVTRVAPGESKLNLTARDWRKAARSPTKISAEDRAINERHVVIDHLGREHVRNGLGEWIS